MSITAIRKYISVHPDICHGKPCFRGTRIMVSLVLEMLEAGAAYKDIKEAYPRLTKQHLKAALLYAARVLDESKFRPTLLT